MKITDIMLELHELNAAEEKPAKKKKAVAAAPARPSSQDLDNQLQFAAARIVAALKLEEKGISAPRLISIVKAHEGAGHVVVN